MAELLACPHVERGLVAWFAGRLPDLPVYTETPADVPDEYLTVVQVGGPGDLRERRVSVELTVCARTRGQVWDLAGLVETAVAALAGDGVPGLLYVDDLVWSFVWADDPLPSVDVRRVTSQVAVTIRPTRAA